MEPRPRLYFFSRKEYMILLLLALMLALLAFTLGVHLGKKVGFRTGEDHFSTIEPGEERAADTEEDTIPSRLDIAEQKKDLKGAVDNTLDQSLHEEVTRTGIKLDTLRQMDLPKKSASKNAGATTLTESHEGAEKAEIKEGKGQEEKISRPSGKFTIQVGSYQNIVDAKEQIKTLETAGVGSFISEAEVANKGRWYRVNVGGYQSKNAAAMVAKKYFKQNVIHSYVVAEMPQAIAE